MIRDLIRAFKSAGPQGTLADELERMVVLAGELVRQAGRVYWEGVPEVRADAASVHRRDGEVNQIQRHLRCRLVAQLAAEEHPRSAKLLSFMSTSKDVERLGDYAKNLTELATLTPGGPPEGAIRDALSEVRTGLERALDEVPRILREQDEKAAQGLIDEGRKALKVCDRLVGEVAASEMKAAEAVSSALAARYYKRLQAHVLNLMSSVVMPLPDLDYFSPEKERDKKPSRPSATRR